MPARPWVAGRVGRARATDQGEHGAVALFVIAFAVILFVGAGLVVDGGLALNARQRAADVAAEAARAGSQAIDEQELRTSGQVVLDPGAAEAAARAYLARVRAADSAATSAVEITGGDADADADEITVTVDVSVATAILQIINIGPFDVSGEATACPATGTDIGECRG